jgi:probable rRNA maturation factor
VTMTLRIHKGTTVRIPTKALHRLFDVVVAGEAGKKWQADINLVFTNDRKIRQLNSAYRGKDKATDVLSFNIDEPMAVGGVFGEIYVSRETAARQAAEYEATPAEEYLRLTCHGLLHLFGYDHVRRADALVMQKKERHYLELVTGTAA